MGNTVRYTNLEGYTGEALIQWIPENQYSVAHYDAVYTVPFQPSRRESLFIFDKEKLPEAIEKATNNLKWELVRCTLCG